jgi:hypothetical protein
MGKGGRLLNVRLSELEHQLVERAVALSGFENRSEWLRQHLLQAAYEVVADADRPEVGLRWFVPVCTHPPQARRQRALSVVCGVCGSRIRSLL